MGMDASAKLTHGFHLSISPEHFAKVALKRELTDKEQERCDDLEGTELLEEMVAELGLELTIHLHNEGGDPRYVIGSKAVVADWDEPTEVVVPRLTPEQVLKCEDLRTKLLAETEEFSAPPSHVALWLTADFW